MELSSHQKADAWRVNVNIQLMKVLPVLLLHIWRHEQNSLCSRRKHIYICTFITSSPHIGKWRKLQLLFLLNYVKFLKLVILRRGAGGGKRLSVHFIRIDGYLMSSDLSCTGGLKLEQTKLEWPGWDLILHSKIHYETPRILLAMCCLGWKLLINALAYKIHHRSYNYLPPGFICLENVIEFRPLPGGGMHLQRETTRWWYGVTIFFKNNKERGFV